MSSWFTYWTTVAVLTLLWTVCCGQDGTYGSGETCGNCTGGVSCNNVTGNCNECEPGFDYNVDHQCKTKCNSSYGPQCREKCKQCLKGEDCDAITGKCHRGCEEGFIGGLCDVACPAGTYGKDCKQRCGQCADGEVCNHVSGNCTTGCQHGYTGSRCDVECVNGTWGDNCNQTCGHCANNAICRKDDGLCPLGCELNYLMPKCTDLPPQPWSNCSCKKLYFFRMSVYVLSPMLGVAVLLLIVAVCIFCHRHHRSSRSLRALRQETTLNEVHRQLKDTLVPLNFDSSSRQSPVSNAVTSFTYGHRSSHRGHGDSRRKTPDASEAQTSNDENKEDYQNWDHGGRQRPTPDRSGPRNRGQQCLGMNGPRWHHKQGGNRGRPTNSKSSTADQEEIYINEL